MVRPVAYVIMIMAAISLLYGCAKKEVGALTPIQELEAPDWVTKGGGAFSDNEGKFFYGVGSASDIRNFSLLRSTADNRARSDVSKVFKFYTSSLMKDYMASTTAGEPGVTSEEQHVEQAIRTVTSMTLSGVEIIDHWQHPQSGEIYSLARLDLAAFMENLRLSGELDNKSKEYIRRNADRLHEELQREVEGRD